MCLACYNPPRQYKHCILGTANILRHRKDPKYLSGGGGPTGPNVVRQLVSMLKIAVRLHRTAYSALFKTQIKYDLATNFAWTSDIQ